VFLHFDIPMNYQLTICDEDYVIVVLVIIGYYIQINNSNNL